MSYPSYLVHFNPNHDPKTGQFTWSKQKSNSNRDSDLLATRMSKYADSYANYLNSSKTRYLTEKGSPIKRADGKFASIFIYDTKKYDKWKQETEDYLYVKKLLQKKYKDVTSKADITDTGESFIRVVLTDKQNNVYETTMKKTYNNNNFNRYEFKEAYS